MRKYTLVGPKTLRRRKAAGGQFEHRLLTAEEERTASRKTLVMCNQRLVLKEARRRAGMSKADVEDLVQAGNIGLMRAAELFDPAKGCRFTTYATWWIRQAIGRELRRSGVIPIPDCMWDRGLRPPPTSAIPDGLDFPGKPVDADEVIDPLRVYLEKGIRHLTPMQADIIRRRFFGDQTLEECGEALDLSRERIRQIQNIALKRLRWVISRDRLA